MIFTTFAVRIFAYPNKHLPVQSQWLQKGVKYVHTLTIQNVNHNLTIKTKVILVSLLLTLDIFHVFLSWF